ncbi:hypothetical protein J007_03415, partial [Cryptococcus neoformans]
NDELHHPFVNTHDELVGLVYTKQTAHTLIHQFPEVLFFDCTYKTNLYWMPMLHIIGS